MGSVVLPHLRTGWHVDQAILSEEDRLVVIRFGRDHDPDCMRQDEVLYKIADKVKNFAVSRECTVLLCPRLRFSPRTRAILSSPEHEHGLIAARLSICATWMRCLISKPCMSSTTRVPSCSFSVTST